MLDRLRHLFNRQQIEGRDAAHQGQPVRALSDRELAIMTPEEAVKGAPTGIPEPSIATSLPANGDPSGVRAIFAGLGVSYYR
jgi:hypothetical protein